MAWRALYPYAAAVRNRSLETTQVAIGLKVHERSRLESRLDAAVSRAFLYVRFST